MVHQLAESERDEIAVIGITLDPEHDDPGILRQMSEAQGVKAPLFQFCTGKPAKVEAILDRLAVARTRDPVTGVIDHANLFLLVDRRGRIAYRLTLGARQERWLAAALRVLLREPRTAKVSKRL